MSEVSTKPVRQSLKFTAVCDRQHCEQQKLILYETKLQSEFCALDAEKKHGIISLLIITQKVGGI